MRTAHTRNDTKCYKISSRNLKNQFNVAAVLGPVDLNRLCVTSPVLRPYIASCLCLSPSQGLLALLQVRCIQALGRVEKKPVLLRTKFTANELEFQHENLDRTKRNESKSSESRKIKRMSKETHAEGTQESGTDYKTVKVSMI